MQFPSCRILQIVQIIESVFNLKNFYDSKIITSEIFN